MENYTFPFLIAGGKENSNISTNVKENNQEIKL